MKHHVHLHTRVHGRVAAVSTVAIALTLAASQASALTIDFNSLPVGTTLSNQFAGVAFAPNAFSGGGGPVGNWATDTDMTIVSSTGADVGDLGTPALVSGNLLRSFSGWLNEDGDPSFSISFATPITSFSADFAGIFAPSSTRLFIYNGLTLLSTVSAVSTGQATLGFSSGTFNRVVITPGTFNDWVGVDNIVYAPVPEVGTYAMMSLGLASLLGWRRRRQG